MKKNTLMQLFLMVTFLLAYSSLRADDKYKLKKEKDENGYEYEYVTNDPRGVRIYTLKNGLKVYLSINKEEPRIQTFIAVRAGSTFDPRETTGLAHYLEHMMFKGTSKIGTVEWEKEKQLLKEISDLFEKHKEEKEPAKKKEIYAAIDSLSALAAKYSVANEYDKLVSAMGAKGTNAHTWHERTVYINNIPTNELEKWLKVESERFSELVLRLFHTELETVYEEFNMSQDNDGRKVSFALMDGLFPNHPYGQQTTIGEAEHLKNPSLVNIHNYWNTYYVPNNMAFALSGDLDFEKTIQLIDKYFGQFKTKEVPTLKQPKESPIKEPVVREVFGPTAENLALAYRFKGDNTLDQKMVTLINLILFNRTAGLIDLNLIQKQKVLRAGCYTSFFTDYGMHQFYAYPRKGQTLEEAKDLLLEQIEKVKKGEFPDWLIKAVINDLKLSEIRNQESEWGAYDYVEAFLRKVSWEDRVKFISELEKITKADIVKFANENYKNNYVLVYKKVGEDKNIAKIEKPKITSVSLNRDSESEYFKDFQKIKSESLKPDFLDFGKLIKKEKLSSGIELNYIKNKSNELFSLIYVIDMGKFHNIKLPFAVNFLPFLGTSKYSPADLQQEFYKLGIKMDVYAGNERSYVFIDGLKSSMDEGVKLLEHVLADVKPDEAILKEYVKGIVKKREDAKKDKSTIIFQGLWNYGQYGADNPFNTILSEDELNKLTAKELTDIIKKIFSFKHYMFYYGADDMAMAKSIIEEHHKTGQLKPYPDPKKFTEQLIKDNKVYFVDYDMVQAQVLMISPDQKFEKSLIPYAQLYSEFYGMVVFQEIREARGMAYAAGTWFERPNKKDRHFYVNSYYFTQADKLKEATNAMLEIMNNMPKAEKQFNNAKESVIKKIESERITKSSIFWNYLQNKELGIDYDIRKDVYEKMKSTSMEDFEEFFNKHIKNKKYTFLVIGKKSQLDMDVLKSLGEFKELTLENVFNY